MRTGDRTPLLRFLSPSALACHAAPVPGRRHLTGVSRSDVHSASMVLLRPEASRERHTCFACFRATPCTHAPATPVRPCGFLRLAEFGPVDSGADRSRAFFGREAPPFSTRRCIARAEPAAGHAPSATFGAAFRYPLTRVTWPGRAPFRRRSSPGFPSRDRGRTVNGAAGMCHACDGVAFDALRPTALLGFQIPFAGLIPRTGGSRVSTGPDPLAVCRSVGRSGFAARSAGPVEKCGAPGVSTIEAPCKHGGQTGRRQRTGARWVGRSRIGRFGFWVYCPCCSRLWSAHAGVRLFRRGRILPWALASLRFDGCGR